MPKFTVTMPLTGSLIFFDVEAEDEKSAIEACFERDFRLDVKGKGVELGDEFNLHEKVVKGNFCNATVNEAFAEEEDENFTDADDPDRYEGEDN